MDKTENQFDPQIEDFDCTDCKDVLATLRYLDQCKRCLKYHQHLCSCGAIDFAIRSYRNTGKRELLLECHEILPDGRKVLISECKGEIGVRLKDKDYQRLFADLRRNCGQRR